MTGFMVIHNNIKIASERKQRRKGRKKGGREERKKYED